MPRRRGLRLTILGCGSSGGVPRIGGVDGRGNWGACDPANRRNRRRRCALLAERFGSKGVTRVLIDTGPDMREQLLSARVDALDAVLYTHDHADHTHGLDDLRVVAIAQRARVPVWADPRTGRMLLERFGYVFKAPPGSSYPPILTLHEIKGPVQIDGAGGAITATPFVVTHGDIDALGFRFGDAAYIPDLNALPKPARQALKGLDTLVIDALRYTPHPSHAHVELTLQWIAELKPRRAILTNLHVDLDYAALAAELPEGVEPAYDGLSFKVE